ncbi:MAG: hypothetical protein ACE5OZ_01075 [Candidatus Heimdallarchaeota archaeon]
MTSYRDNLIRSSPTPIHRLRKLEKALATSEIGSLYELKTWLRIEKFHQLVWTGEPKESDLQYYRQIGKGRYHLRIYDHPDRIVLESHFDRRDPGRGLTKPRSFEEMLEDISVHYEKDVLSNPKHHIIVLLKRPQSISFQESFGRAIRKLFLNQQN